MQIPGLMEPTLFHRDLRLRSDCAVLNKECDTGIISKVEKNNK